MAGVSVLELGALDELVSELQTRGFTVIGPRVQDGVIVLGEIASGRDLPVGIGEVQDGGEYRLRERDDGALFGFANGPQAWKRLLFPPRQRVWSLPLDGAITDRDGADREEPRDEAPPRYAFVGVRACDLAAIGIQDRVFLGGRYQDPSYGARRHQAFVIAVNCTTPGGTCFCDSMGTGPRATHGFDLALTEILDGDRHHFVVEAATEEGRAVLASVAHRSAEAVEVAEVDRVLAGARERMGRRLDATGLPALLAGAAEHPRWEAVGDRCLACGNCTLVCPTCFCSTFEDVTDVAGHSAERWRRWDSCFTLDFSYLHGGSVRTSTASRYRQWLTHKLGTWHEQFGTSGCVGCGRCITWCPVAIDITEELEALRAPIEERS